MTVPWNSPDFCVISYLNATMIDGERVYWLPRDIIGTDGKTLIVYRKADDTCRIDGWEPWHDGMFGGRRENVESAFAWVQRAKDMRAGKAKDFLLR